MQLLTTDRNRGLSQRLTVTRARLITVLLAVVVVLVAGCSSSDSSPDFVLTPVVEGQGEYLTAMAVRPDDPRLYVTEKSGRLLAVEDGDPEVLLDLTPEVASEDLEQGLLGVAFSPSGSHIYLVSVDPDNVMVLDEYEMVGSEPDVASRRTLLSLPNVDVIHYGGTVRFGPDGMLWVAVGDDGDLYSALEEALRDPDGAPPGDLSMHNSQDPSSLHGKLLRIDPSAGEPYGIPPDNPFAAGGGAPEVWALGLRNPWGFGFDRETGDLWIPDVGFASWEEVNLAPAPQWGRGANYGWPYLEGTHPLIEGTTPPGLEDPVFEYRHSAEVEPDEPSGCAIIGGYVYRGELVPDLEGEYLFADFCNGRIGIYSEGEGAFLGPSVDALVAAFGEDADGELYVLTSNGDLFRIDPA